VLDDARGNETATRPLGLRIEPLRREDHGRWLELWQGYLAFYKTTLDDETIRTTFERLLDPREPMHAVLAWQGERAVGLAHFLTHRSCWTRDDYCYLQDLFTDEMARGAGVGRALIAHVEAWARANGCSRLYWLTHESNAPAMRLYDQVADRPGFIQYRKIF
jgi:GNAT superfamily N-acetyltransferase